MIGIDTTAIIDLVKGETIPSFDENERIFLADIVYFESLLGMKNESKLKELSSGLEKVSFSHKIAERASEIFKVMRKKGKEIGQADCLIAATYLENGISKILTRNKKHFEQIPGIEVVDY